MNIQISIDAARANFLLITKHLEDIPKAKQGQVLEYLSFGLKQLDHLEELVGSKPRMVRENLPSNEEVMGQIWNDMNTTSMSDYKIMLMRLEPHMMAGNKINGYLDTHHLPTTIPDIIEKTGMKYGGGKYQLRIVDDSGKYVKSKTFEISGLPKLPE